MGGGGEERVGGWWLVEKRLVLLILPNKSMVSVNISTKYKVLSYSCTADI